MSTATPRNAKPAPSKAPSKKVPTKMPVAAPKASAKVPNKIKPIAKTATKTAAKPVPKVKQKPVRDSFTMPQADFDLIDALKQRALGFKRPVKKSELLRAGLHALASLSDAQLRGIVDQLTALKPGRPKKAD